MSIRKDKFSTESLTTVRDQVGRLDVEVKEARKSMQVLMQVPETADYDEAEELLSKATKILKM